VRLADAVLFGPAPGGALAKAYPGNTKSVWSHGDVENGVFGLQKQKPFGFRRKAELFWYYIAHTRPQQPTPASLRSWQLLKHPMCAGW
jgi:hypothetical protein